MGPAHQQIHRDLLEQDLMGGGSGWNKVGWAEQGGIGSGNGCGEEVDQTQAGVELAALHAEFQAPGWA